jgi:hypothetical protein
VAISLTRLLEAEVPGSDALGRQLQTQHASIQSAACDALLILLQPTSSTSTGVAARLALLLLEPVLVTLRRAVELGLAADESGAAASLQQAS